METTSSTPASFGPEYDEIDRQLAMLHLIWRTYRELFATSEPRFNLLKDSVPGFSWLLHHLLVDAVMLGICRLSDPAETCGKPNLTFAQLRTALIPKPDATQLGWLDTQLYRIKDDMAKLKEHRNKRIAHSDLSSSLNLTGKLPDVSRQVIERLLAAMRDIMNGVKDWHNAGGTDYDVISPGGADSLLWCLRQASRLSELQDDYHCRRLASDEILNKLGVRQFEET